MDLEPGKGGGRIQGKIVLRKSVLIFLTVFADGFGPLRSGFGARDGRGSDPGKNSVKKISTHFLNGNCGWILALLGSRFGARDGRGSDPGENSVKKISTHFLNGICG